MKENLLTPVERQTMVQVNPDLNMNRVFLRDLCYWVIDNTQDPSFQQPPLVVFNRAASIEEAKSFQWRTDPDPIRILYPRVDLDQQPSEEHNSTRRWGFFNEKLAQQSSAFFRRNFATNRQIPRKPGELHVQDFQIVVLVPPSEETDESDNPYAPNRVFLTVVHMAAIMTLFGAEPLKGELGLFRQHVCAMWNEHGKYLLAKWKKAIPKTDPLKRETARVKQCQEKMAYWIREVESSITLKNNWKRRLADAKTALIHRMKI